VTAPATRLLLASVAALGAGLAGALLWASALADRLAALEARDPAGPGASPGPAPADPSLAPEIEGLRLQVADLRARVRELETRPAPSGGGGAVPAEGDLAAAVDAVLRKREQDEIARRCARAAERVLSHADPAVKWPLAKRDLLAPLLASYLVSRERLLKDDALGERERAAANTALNDDLRARVEEHLGREEGARLLRSVGTFSPRALMLEAQPGAAQRFPGPRPRAPGGAAGPEDDGPAGEE
jgi:hypothetical protein